MVRESVNKFKLINRVDEQLDITIVFSLISHFCQEPCTCDSRCSVISTALLRDTVMLLKVSFLQWNNISTCTKPFLARFAHRLMVTGHVCY